MKGSCMAKMPQRCGDLHRGPVRRRGNNRLWLAVVLGCVGMVGFSCARPRGVYIDLLDERWTARPLTARAVEDMGANSPADSLLSGWGARETDGEGGEGYRWVTAEQAEVVFWLVPLKAGRLTFRAWPLTWEGAPEQVVTVSVNGKAAGQTVLRASARTYSMPLAPGLLAAGRNVVAFSFSRLAVPHERLAGSSDTRSLAAAFAWIEISERTYAADDRRPAGVKVAPPRPEVGKALYTLVPGQGLSFAIRVPRVAPRLVVEGVSFGTVAHGLDLWVKAEGVARKLELPSRRAGEHVKHGVDLGFVAGADAELVLVPRISDDADSARDRAVREERVVEDLLSPAEAPRLSRSHVVFDFEAEECATTLGAGWARPERDANSAESFAWAVAQRAEVELSLLPEDFHWLSFRAWPFTWSGAPSQVVHVVVNGVSVGRKSLPAGPSTVSLPVPKNLVKAGKNLVVFEFSRTSVPRDHLAGSVDLRSLAAAFSWIEVSVSPLSEHATRPRLAATGIGEPTSHGFVLMPGTGLAFSVNPSDDPLHLRFDLASMGEESARVRVFARRTGTDHGVMIRECAAGMGGMQCEAPLLNLASEGGEVVIHATATRASRAAEVSLLVARPRLVSASTAATYLTLNRLDVLARPEFETKGRNLVLIVADTLRADHLGCYGGQVRTPHIDSLAERGTLFRNAYAPAPITGPSHAALFTSLHARQTGVRNNGQRLSTSLTTLAELLHSRGYATAAFVSLGVLSEKFGFSQGFDVYDATFASDWMKNAEEINRAASSWARQQQEAPFFLWLHYSDPHEPYAPPDLAYPELAISIGGTEVGTLRANGRGHRIEAILPPGESTLKARATSSGFPYRLLLHLAASDSADISLTPSALCVAAGVKTWLPPLSRGSSVPILDLENHASQPRAVTITVAITEDLPISEVRARYGREVEYMDAHIGRMLALLDARGMLRNSVVVFVGDHGESLGEHEHVGHISRLYEPALRVPFIVVEGKAAVAKRIVDAPVSLLDVLPTVLDLLELQTPASVAGVSLLNTSADELARRPIFAETFPPESPWHRQAVILDGFKLIRTLDEGGDVLELFDLRRDPAELTNSAGSAAGRLRELAERLRLFEAGQGRQPTPAAVIPRLTDEERARLRSLGYLR